MKIIHEIPSIYYEIKKYFPTATWGRLIITYYPNVYCSTDIEDIKKIHEAVHLKQQEEIGVEKWWHMYFHDISFRRKEEIEAYQAEVEWMKANPDKMSREMRRNHVDRIIKEISSPIYGPMMTKKTAQSIFK